MGRTAYPPEITCRMYVCMYLGYSLGSPKAFACFPYPQVYLDSLVTWLFFPASPGQCIDVSLHLGRDQSGGTGLRRDGTGAQGSAMSGSQSKEYVCSLFSLRLVSVGIALLSGDRLAFAMNLSLPTEKIDPIDHPSISVIQKSPRVASWAGVASRGFMFRSQPHERVFICLFVSLFLATCAVFLLLLSL